MILKFFILLSIINTATAEKLDRFPKYDHPPCLYSQLDACKTQNQQDYDFCALNIEKLNEKIENYKQQTEELRQIAFPVENKITIIYNSIAVANKELNFLSNIPNKNTPVELKNSDFFSHSAQIKIFFYGNEKIFSWNEMYPIDHLNQLNKFTSDENDKLIFLQQEKEKLMQNIAYLNSQITSYIAQKNEFSQAQNTHDMMLKIGCKNLFCPSIL